MERIPGEMPVVYQSTVDGSGRIVLPSDVRVSLDLHKGDSVLIIKEGSQVRIETPHQAIEAAQDYFCGLAPSERVLSEELLRERRQEAARE